MSRDSHIKTPLTQSLQQFTKGKAADSKWSLGKGLPVTVKALVPPAAVVVNFEVDAGIWTLPTPTVPILFLQYIRCPIQIGDPGILMPSSVRLGGVTGLGAGTPNLADQPSNLTGLGFMGLGNMDWEAALDPNAVEIYGVGSSGVILRSGDSMTKLTLTSGGIVIDLGGPITINSNGHDVTVSGGGDVIAGGISLKTHVHGGVMTGGGDTGPPT